MFSEVLKKVYSLIAPKIIEDVFTDIIANKSAYLKPAKRLVFTGRTMFLSTAEERNETETDLLATLRQAGRYYKFETPKTSADPAAELIRLRFLAGLKCKERKLNRSDALRPNKNFTAEELLRTLQYRSQLKSFHVRRSHTTSETDSAQDFQNALDETRRLHLKSLNDQQSTKVAIHTK